MSTRGAHGCVRKTPTGLPDCTSSVSSCSSAAQRRDDRVERLPAARRAARAAVDDEIVRPFGDLGIEIVHQHPQRGFLRPSFAGERRAARRAEWRLRVLMGERRNAHARVVAVDGERRIESKKRTRALSI